MTGVKIARPPVQDAPEARTNVVLPLLDAPWNTAVRLAAQAELVHTGRVSRYLQESDEMTSKNSLRYHRRTDAFAGDPMHAAAGLAASGRHDEYVLYEDAAHWTYAGGVLAEIYADADGIHLRGVAEEDLPWDDRPFERVQALLRALPVDGWHAYGWAAFELHHACAHGTARGDGRYLHLVVPRTEVRIRAGQAHLRSVDPDDLEATSAVLSRREVPDRSAAAPIAVREYGAADYKDRAQRAVDLINSTAIEKIILSRKIPVERGVDFVGTYLTGRAGNRPARSFLLDLGGVQAAGFCPEIVVQVDTDRHVTVRPLAGTRALTGDREEDARLRADLVGDPKEVYEHAVSVKQACEAVSAVCASVVVEEFMAVRERGSVQHLGSTITGELAPDRSVWDALMAVFPSVTASGIPREEACAAIRDLETQPRRLYSGAVLSIDQDGTFDSGLVLRGVYREHGATWLQAGAGIIGQSTPDREFEETCEKLDSVARFVVHS
ncbi:salicylate synthase [Actinosynnema sp. NPDC050436]|uniref:salicylate synthase n=1 Tax=Actinosynnema sp. NPDC050436 TaxID=3155659 RepID=UPI00340A11C4